MKINYVTVSRRNTFTRKKKRRILKVDPNFVELSLRLKLNRENRRTTREHNFRCSRSVRRKSFLALNDLGSLYIVILFCKHELYRLTSSLTVAVDLNWKRILKKRSEILWCRGAYNVNWIKVLFLLLFPQSHRDPPSPSQRAPKIGRTLNKLSSSLVVLHYSTIE